MIRSTLKITALLVLAAVSLDTIAGEKEEIVARCRKQMSEYGSAMVKACVDHCANSISESQRRSPLIRSASILTKVSVLMTCS